MNPNQPTTVRAGEELAIEPLDFFLKNHLPNFSGIEKIAQFTGGFSNLTYCITDRKGQSIVLRRPPFGNHVGAAHDMAREFRTLCALQNLGFSKIPTPLFLCADTDVLGVPFFIMRRLEGVVLRANKVSDKTLSPETMRHISEKWLENLIDLHRLDVENTELATLGKPEGYVQRQVEGWAQRYQKAQTDDIPEMTQTANWLKTFQPKFQKPALLHNDYKFDNLIFTLDLREITGILDWEMATLGDPLMDLGAALAYWCESDDPPFMKNFNITWLSGSLKRQELADLYAQKTGRDLSDIVFYYVFGLFKNAVIMQQIYARWKKGLTKDPRFGALIHGVHTLAQVAVKSVQNNKI
jgi:aminoglycoside phosphotransferase (APT) family kinase protein